MLVFVATLLGTFAVALLGRRHSKRVGSATLSDHRLNKWLVGLSAGATANSGFVVTAAVGLGYSFGVHWILLPLSWLLGDAMFWIFFPQRINATGRAVGATTMTDVIVHDLDQRPQLALKRIVAILIIICLGGYVSAQWLAGQKFLNGAFGLSGPIGLALFAAIIVCYTAIGGFRGSVYVDSMQAVIRIGGTVIALAAVFYVASQSPIDFWRNIHAAGPTFLKIIPDNHYLVAIPFIFGFAAAALGFGLGQPQMVTRYLAGATPAETRSAWAIYNFFVQFTWISMTVFGVVLRGIIPSLSDPEAGLSTFFRLKAGPIFTGIIVADIFATIAATSNSLLVAMAQTTSRDLGGPNWHRQAEDLWPVTALLGAGTMLLSLNLHGTVFALALLSVSLLGAALAPAMLVRILHLRSTGTSLTASVLAGFTTAALWSYFGLSGTMNEAAPGMLIAFATNFVLARLPARSGARGGLRDADS